jgi:uncharacterized protein (TIGR03067 family)
MNHSLTLSLFACLLLGVGRLPAQGDGDAKKIQGDWVTVLVLTDGREARLPPEKNRKVKVTAEKMETSDGEPATTYKLGADKGLRTIDVTGPEGKTLKGIYDLDGDVLILCLPLRPEGERPTEITSAGRRAVPILKREKR